jgi:hypothetical protein
MSVKGSWLVYGFELGYSEMNRVLMATSSLMPLTGALCGKRLFAQAEGISPLRANSGH